MYVKIPLESSLFSINNKDREAWTARRDIGLPDYPIFPQFGVTQNLVLFWL